MSTLDLVFAWLKVVSVWATIAVFCGTVVGIGIVVARAVITALGGALG